LKSSLQKTKGFDPEKASALQKTKRPRTEISDPKSDPEAAIASKKNKNLGSGTCNEVFAKKTKTSIGTRKNFDPRPKIAG